MNEQMTNGMFMNSNSSNGSNSDDEKCRLSTYDLIYSDDNKDESMVKQQILPFRFHESRRRNDFNDDDDLRMEKTGWLNVKLWMTVVSHEKVELTSKTQSKRFWIWLKDSNLRLFNDYLDINPKFMINTIDCLCYPFPEQGEYVFSLTTQTGDIYCFQSTNQFELDHWIRCIHTNCLLEMNKNLLKSHIKQLENDIIYEKKILKLTELQLKLTTNNKTRLILIKQIEFYEKNFELLNINLFRKKSYLSSLNYQEYVPNSKELLSHISSTTKSILYSLHAFTPCAFYALIISRQQLKQQINQIVLFNTNPQKRIVISINRTTTTVGELLKRVTDKLDLEINDYFLYFNSTSIHGFTPNLNTKLHTLIYSSVEICRKIIYEIIFNNQINLSGIEINREYSSKVFVSYIKKGSEGERLGVIKGDEIIMINSFIVEDLDSVNFNRYINQTPIMLTFRSSRLTQTTSIIKNTKENSRYSQSNKNNEQIEKVILELIQTEKSYIHDMQCLTKQYIEPLNNNSTILSSDVITSLYDSVKSIEQLQVEFLEDLQLNLLTENIVISICETFIKYSKDFKIYSTYCSIHLRINRILNSIENTEYLKEFLIQCNPSHQHALSFESYLIKPIQRILKYPLFLEQMYLYCHINESLILKKSIKIMNKINKYINSMQKLYEDFGQTFEYFIKNSKDKYNQNFQLNLPELYAYGEIDWMNIYRFISKKTSQYLKTFCFVFRYGCLLLVREQLNKKNQEISSNYQTNKNFSDCFIRFIPMKELQVELINNDNNSYHHTWQLIQINPKNQFKTYFRFANKDAQTFVKTIHSCISDLSNSSSMDEKYISSSRSCHDFVSSDVSSSRKSERNSSVNYRRSPSPIWKRRSTSFRKRPLSVPNNKNFK